MPHHDLVTALMQTINAHAFQARPAPRIAGERCTGTQLMAIIRLTSSITWPAEAARIALNRMEHACLDVIATGPALLDIDPRLPPLCPTLGDTAGLCRRVIPE